MCINPSGSSWECDGLIEDFGQMIFISGLSSMVKRGDAESLSSPFGGQPSYLLSSSYGKAGTKQCLRINLKFVPLLVVNPIE